MDKQIREQAGKEFSELCNKYDGIGFVGNIISDIWCGYFIVDFSNDNSIFCGCTLMGNKKITDILRENIDNRLRAIDKN